MISELVFVLVTFPFWVPIPLAASQYTSPTFANLSGPSGPIVDLGYIKAQGTTVTSLPHKYNAWLGIRYADSPIGQQRFAAARPVESTVPPNVTFDATSYGPICYQGYPQIAPQSVTEPLLQFGNRQPSEDCLLLDIYAPAKPVSQKLLPVLLYIHGGGYDVGSSTSSTMSSIFQLAYGAPGHFLVVNIQYRLAGFGFLGGDEVTTFGQPNAGLADQRLAMEWVQRHISSFGGDPSKVTIQGPSAGGGSVAYQYIWKGGEVNPPFRAGISDATWWQTLQNQTQLGQQYQAVLRAANCSDIKCLRGLPAERYYDAQQAVLNDAWRYPYGIFYFGPYVDGYYIRNLPSLELQAGHFSKLPLIIDHDTNEGLSFTPQTIDTHEEFERRVATVFPAAGDNFLNRVYTLYPASTTGLYGYNTSVGQQLRSDYFFGDTMIACPTYYIASSLSDAGVPVYKYVYGLPTFTTAGHGKFLDLFVPTPDNDTSPSAILGRQFLKYYIPNFIMMSNPNDNSWLDDDSSNNTTLSNVAQWPAYGAQSRILFVNSTTTPVLITSDLDARGQCDFFWSRSV
ncbi:hypothetical protein ASPVEDRAFT_88987 [Aspergillus versicolor CBS 583.65]|uniref:Carboxylic ester hydrolase n=1 Tax=Aspergillus versicolor CBS 583.65 TaxID=1036611 RepID=A0A1L9Q1U3_ASPVE|nr:uncharacterized protein ASPVEDRAFT_88987 [Aspergillus versicolor CBS 583.65]OJJ07747.1 hypothetical protein ASPVEDRAFT_88987 [Aspergillus versicolor CBS 583.65]